MTEEEWWKSNKVDDLLRFLLGGSLAPGPGRLLATVTAGKRKLRLFTCACCRHIWHLMADESQRHVVEVAERYVDGLATEEEFRVSSENAERLTEREVCSAYFARQAAVMVGNPKGIEFCEEDVSYYAVNAVSFVKTVRLKSGSKSILFDPKIEAAEYETHCSFLRDIFGNPFRPVTLDPQCLTPPVKQLATAIYEDRTFDRLPILADLLQEAGCDQEDILKHVRGNGEHVRGCWALDLVLGKS